MLILTKNYAVKTGQPRYKLPFGKLRTAKLRILKTLFAKKSVIFFREKEGFFQNF